MSIKLQALVHGHLCQTTTSEILGTFVASVHTLRPLLGSVRERAQNNPGAVPTHLYVWKIHPLGERVKSYNCELPCGAEPVLACFTY